MASVNSYNQLKIGLIGCGKWGKYILRDLVNLGSTVYTVARSKSSIQNARDGGSYKIVDEVEKLALIDGAIVATPTKTHFEIILKLLPLNIPIFVEKPFTDCIQELEILKSHADKIFVMDKWRYHQGILKLRQIEA